MLRIMTIIVWGFLFAAAASAEDLSTKKLLYKINSELKIQTEIIAQIEANTAVQGADLPDPPLRALWDEAWDGFSCYGIIFLDTGFRAYVPNNHNSVLIEVPTRSARALTPAFGTRDEAEDMLINLFIRMNGLDATPDDVPLDGSGQRDCQTWNDQLIGQ